MSTTKTLLVLYKGDDWSKKQPTFGPGLQATYPIWGELCRAKKIRLCRASIEWFSGSAFTKYWEFSGGTWLKKESPLKPTVIYDKCSSHDEKTGELLNPIFDQKRLIAARFEIVNDPHFTQLVKNKLFQAALFYDVLPRTTYVPAGRSVKNTDRHQLVVKSLAGYGGDFVSITSQPEIKTKYPVIVQEFIDARLKGKIKDYRIGFIGNRPHYVYNRIAPKGSLMTNVHLGGSMEFIPLAQVQSLVRLSQKLMQRFSAFPKYVVSFDYMIDTKKNKPYLIEVETMPGSGNFDEPLLRSYFGALTDYLFS